MSPSPEYDGLKHLSRAEARVVDALALTMFPEGGPLAAGARTAECVRWIDGFLGWLPVQQRLLIRSMFFLFEADFAVFNPGSSNRFSTASPEERQRCLESWDRSEIYTRRAAFQALKGVMLLAYLRHPEVHRQMGLKRGEVALRDLARSGRVATHERTVAA